MDGCCQEEIAQCLKARESLKYRNFKRIHSEEDQRNAREKRTARRLQKMQKMKKAGTHKTDDLDATDDVFYDDDEDGASPSVLSASEPFVSDPAIENQQQRVSVDSGMATEGLLQLLLPSSQVKDVDWWDHESVLADGDL